MAILLITPIDLGRFSELPEESRQIMENMFGNDYRLGWYREWPGQGAIYSVWGQSKNKELALKVAKETKERDNCDVFTYNKPVREKEVIPVKLAEQVRNEMVKVDF